MTREQLASLLCTSTGRISRLLADLDARGWLRAVRIDDLPRPRDLTKGDHVSGLGLVVLTEAGRREAVRRLVVTAELARRRHGLIHPDASRRRFVRHVHHTVGANAFFVDLAAAAIQVTSRDGHDDALIEWRSAAACARGRFGPDGYGCYRRGPWRFGFFLEYDRRTERLTHYAAKLAAYYRYRDSGPYKRDYDSFPTLLVVKTSDVAEVRFAHQAYLAKEHHGATPLRMFLTTTSRIEVHADGILGPIWRSAATPMGA